MEADTLIMPRSVPNMGSRSGDHTFNTGPMYLWAVAITIENRGRYNLIVLASTSEIATELANKFIFAEYTNPVILRITVVREMGLVVHNNN